MIDPSPLLTLHWTEPWFSKLLFMICKFFLASGVCFITARFHICLMTDPELTWIDPSPFDLAWSFVFVFNSGHWVAILDRCYQRSSSSQHFIFPQWKTWPITCALKIIALQSLQRSYLLPYHYTSFMYLSDRRLTLHIVWPFTFTLNWGYWSPFFAERSRKW